jgi:hypothetical protein
VALPVPGTDGGTIATERDATVDFVPDADGVPDAGTDLSRSFIDAGAPIAVSGANDGGEPFDGSPCIDGRCIATLATGQDDPFAIATDGIGVYWTNNANGAADAGSVMRVAVDGGSPVALATGLSQPRYLAIDDTRVYWTDISRVTAWSKAYGTIATVASLQGFPEGIAVDRTNVYWANEDPFDGGVMSIGLDGGTPRSVATDDNDALLLAISPTTVYWVDYADAYVWSAPLAGGSRSLFFDDSEFDIAGIAIDGANLYYTEQSAGGPLGVLPLDGGAPRILSHDNGTLGVVSDGTYVYYTSPDGNAPVYNGSVVRVPLDGGAPTTLVTGGAPEAIAIDATSVYWTSSSTGSVMKLTPR